MEGGNSLIPDTMTDNAVFFGQDTFDAVSTWSTKGTSNMEPPLVQRPPYWCWTISDEYSKYTSPAPQDKGKSPGNWTMTCGISEIHVLGITKGKESSLMITCLT